MKTYSLNRVLEEYGFTALLVKVIFHPLTKIPLIRNLILKAVIYDLSNKMKNCDNLDQSIKLVFSYKKFGIDIKPMQVMTEIGRLLRILEQLRPETLLEIGTARGGTLFLFTRIASPTATFISIDLPGGMFGGGYEDWRIALYKSFALDRQKIYLIRADSHSINTLNNVKSIIDDKKIDFLFIDGDHSYEGVKKDFEMYSTLVRKGGIIAFHDIVPHDRAHDPCGVVGVPRFWNEIKHSYKYLEIVKDWSQGWAGIGVLYV